MSVALAMLQVPSTSNAIRILANYCFSEKFRDF